jgi:DNA primase large subunit
MLYSEVALAKYPFTSEASEYVSRVGLEIHELGDPDYREITERAVERVKEAIVRGRVSWKGAKRSDIEIFSYPVALFFVSKIRDGFLIRRYVLAEAERAYSLLQKEEGATLIDIAADAFGWKTRILERDAGRPSGFTVHFSHYLRNATVFNDDKWKLVNRTMVEGEVYLQQPDYARLLSEEVKTHINQRLRDTPEIELPPSLTERVAYLTKALEMRKATLPRGRLPRGIFMDAYPPCIAELHKALIEGQSLSHFGRFTLTSFLLNIGMQIDAVVELYTSVSDFDESLTRYQVRHIAGATGSGVKYRAPNCKTVKTHGLCPGPDSLCNQISRPLSYYRTKLRRGRRVRSGGASTHNAKPQRTR